MLTNAPAFFVQRRCQDGECPVSDGVCDCSETTVEVDVDELLEHEVAFFLEYGTTDQRAELEEYFAPAPLSRQVA